MTKHDTWAKLKPSNPLEPIAHLFPNGVPLRDPFPLEYAREAEAVDPTPLVVIDIYRLSPEQKVAIAQIWAIDHTVSHEVVLADAENNGGFLLAYSWLESMRAGNEGFGRLKEYADFLDANPDLTLEAWQEFYNSQYSRWIDGDEQPPPINSIDDTDPRLVTPELETEMQRYQIEQMLGGYSVFDVLTGRAMTDILNTLDPEHEYSLVGDDDEDFTEEEEEV
ncbi:MAG TPA: hypothetical protein VK203_07790 [Nostocaceae cyanobacterium]|nr:hypothetical protein [Nostocaceae cyanobacterium]